MGSWYSTIVVRLNDVHGSPIKKRFLLTNKIEKAYIFASAVQYSRWMVKEIPGEKKPSKFLVTLVEDDLGHHRFPAFIEILNESDRMLHLGSVLEEKKIPFPVLSREEYSKFYAYMFHDKLYTAETDIHARSGGRKWLKIDGVMGRNYFSALGMALTKTKLTEKYSAVDSDFGVLLVAELEKFCYDGSNDEY